MDVISDDDTYGMLAEIELIGRMMGGPLHQLEPIEVNDNTRQVIEDWQYWIANLDDTFAVNTGANTD